MHDQAKARSAYLKGTEFRTSLIPEAQIPLACPLSIRDLPRCMRPSRWLAVTNLVPIFHVDWDIGKTSVTKVRLSNAHQSFLQLKMAQ